MGTNWRFPCWLVVDVSFCKWNRGRNKPFLFAFPFSKMNISIASSAALVLSSLLSVYTSCHLLDPWSYFKLIWLKTSPFLSIHICVMYTYMHRSNVFQLEQFTVLASQMGRCAWLLAQGTDSHQGQWHSSPLSRGEHNLRWQQLPEEFGCIGKLHPQLQLQRRAGFAAGAHLPSPSWAQTSPASGGVSSGDQTSQERFTTAVGLVCTACAMKQVAVRSWEHPSGQRGSPGGCKEGSRGTAGHWLGSAALQNSHFRLAVKAQTGNCSAGCVHVSHPHTSPKPIFKFSYLVTTSMLQQLQIVLF